jgi:transcription elongation factor Elf1
MGDWHTATTIGGWFICAYCGAWNRVLARLTPAARRAGIRCIGCGHVFHFARAV